MFTKEEALLTKHYTRFSIHLSYQELCKSSVLYLATRNVSVRQTKSHNSCKTHGRA